jgi:hypothetical protein
MYSINIKNARGNQMIYTQKSNKTGHWYVKQAKVITRSVGWKSITTNDYNEIRLHEAGVNYYISIDNGDFEQAINLYISDRDAKKMKELESQTL